MGERPGGHIRVEVAYALPEVQTVVEVSLPQGANIRDALDRSGITGLHPEIDPAHATVGVFGRRKALDAPLSDGDRVEVYRPLVADAKQARRNRARRRQAG
jgi:uncharacterized protein